MEGARRAGLNCFIQRTGKPEDCMKKTDNPGVPPGPGERKLTVSEVRVRPTHAEVTFFETARIYRLPNGDPGHNRYLRLLESAAAKRRPVLVQFSAPNSEVIANVREA